MTGSGTTLRTHHDVYDVAQLAGGLARVVDAAVSGLLEQGRLRVDGTGRLQALGTATHPVEVAVLDLAGPRPRRSLQTIRVRAHDDPRITAVAERLLAQGLLRRNPLAGWSSSWPAHLRTAAGRRVLAEWSSTPPAGVRGLDVALGGPQRMADRVLAETVFGPVPRPPARRTGRRADVADARVSSWAYGGWVGGWGGDGGGGGWGGDGGGGCGGGDGGGGGC
jgi:hypothetical protein